MSARNSMYLAAVALIIGIIAIGTAVAIPGPQGPAGETGPEGPAGETGPQGPVAVSAAEPESCAICHKTAGDQHQASYDELYQDGVIAIANLTYDFSASPDTHIVAFDMTKDGEPFDASEADSLGIYFAPYTGSAFQFEPAESRLSLKGDLTYDEGRTTSTLIELANTTDPDFRNYTDLSGVDGLVIVYGHDEEVGRLPARIRQTKYPFAALIETGAGVDYVSAANDAGCVSCHTDPYLKHGYIYAQVNDDATTDFYTCKSCHLDNGEGGHYEWQLLVDDPELAVEWLESDEDLSIFTPEQLALYAYNTSLMNDVHMSHSMEFPYPQSMSNCATCHEGKLAATLTDANFNVATCKSCHAVTGSEEYGTNATAITNLLPSPLHDGLDLATADCTTGCHSEGGIAPVFSEIHTGYDETIYAAADLKYSDAIVITIDDASLANNDLTIQFSAAEDPDLAGIEVADITPTVLVGLYGYDTKDYIIGPHERLFDDNGDGVIDRNDERTLEYDVGDTHPRFTTVSAADGSWEVIADLSPWADLIDDDTVRRVEIAVMPSLENADGDIVALIAPSRTFDLGANDFDDNFYNPLVKVQDGCDNCHDALATTFHTPDRGGNEVVCRLCHITKSRGSHLEMQSRSLDSYIHAIHSMQAFDIGDIDFNDPVEALHYEHHIEFPFPTHGITNCEACHVEGAYEVPDQSKSLPGVLSASDYPLTGWDRNIGNVSLVITGPAAKACGGCHRAHLINEDDANGLLAFYQHTAMGGYVIVPDNDYADDILTAIDDVMANFY